MKILRPGACPLIPGLLAVALVLCGQALLRAQQDGAMLPTGRHVERILPEEKNPFGQKVQVKEEALVVEEETEETRLRKLLGDIPIRGVVQSGDACVMMLGPMTLREGIILPNLLPRQTERVKVLKITETEAIFGFVDRDGRADVRTLPRRVDLAPEVRYLIPSKIPGTADPASSNDLGGVITQGSDGPPFR